jgi:hypothetical protein
MKRVEPVVGPSTRDDTRGFRHAASMRDVRVLEIRTYRIVTGRRAEFHRRFEDGALPMLQRWGIDVVGFGPSLEDDDGEHWVLLRAFASSEERRRQEDAFYGSDEWKTDHRPGIMALIETYHTVVLETSAEAIDSLRRSFAADQSRTGA